MVNDTEPRYRLVDANGNVVGSLFAESDGTLKLQEGRSGSDNEVSVATDGTFNAPAVNTDSATSTGFADGTAKQYHTATTGTADFLAQRSQYTTGVSTSDVVVFDSYNFPYDAVIMGYNQSDPNEHFVDKLAVASGSGYTRYVQNSRGAVTRSYSESFGEISLSVDAGTFDVVVKVDAVSTTLK